MTLVSLARRIALRLLGPRETDAWRAAWRVASDRFSLRLMRLAYRAEHAMVAGAFDVAIRDLEVLRERMPANPAWPLRLSMIAHDLADFEGAERILLDARDAGVCDPDVDRMIDFYARWNRRSNAAEDDALAIATDLGATPLRIYHASIYLSSVGRVAAARAGLARVATERRWRDMADEQLAALDLLEHAGLTRSITVPGWLSPARTSAEAIVPDADTLLVVFTAGGGLAGVPVNVFQAMVPAGVSVLYLFDSRSLYHLTGTDRFGPGYAAMIAGLRAYRDGIGARRLVTLGLSGSGFTALRAALDLEADGAIAFGPPTTMVEADMLRDARYPNRRRRLIDTVDARTRGDLAIDLAGRDCCPRIDIWYGDANAQDSFYAQRLDGIEGVTLHPIVGLDRHDCVGALVRRGETDAVARCLVRP